MHIIPPQTSPKKSKNTLHRSVTQVTSAVKTEGKCTIWNSSPDSADLVDPLDPADQVSGAAAQNHLSTRTGGQDDGSYTNSLKQYIYIYIFSYELFKGVELGGN